MTPRLGSGLGAGLPDHNCPARRNGYPAHDVDKLASRLVASDPRHVLRQIRLWGIDNG